MSDASCERGHGYALFCMGNPLLDILVTNGEKLFEKYNLNPNDLILAEEKHLPMCGFFFFSCTAYWQSPNAHFFLSSEERYDEIVKEQKVVYLAGGASQNAARGAAVCPHHVLPFLSLSLSLSHSMCCPLIQSSIPVA